MIFRLKDVKKIMLTLGLIVIFLLGIWLAVTFITVDACLDAGGRYDYDSTSCIFAERVNYQSPWQRRPLVILSFASILSAIPSYLIYKIVQKLNKGLNHQK